VGQTIVTYFICMLVISCTYAEEQMLVAQVVNKLTAIYETLRFNIVITSLPLSFILNHMNPVQIITH
jgi:hypothetical protein